MCGVEGVCGVEEDVWGEGRCVGWRKMCGVAEVCGVEGGVWGGRCVGWKVCWMEGGSVWGRGRRGGGRGGRCIGWREEREDAGVWGGGGGRRVCVQGVEGGGGGG